MDYAGLFPKFKVNRPLTDEERELQLKQKVRLDVEPIYQIAVIRLNSTFLETTDKFYAWKGWLTLGMCVLTAMIVTFFVALGLADGPAFLLSDLWDWSDFKAIHMLLLLGSLAAPLLVAIGLVLLGAGVALQIGAVAITPTPMQRWLGRSYFGKDPSVLSWDGKRSDKFAKGDWAAEFTALQESLAEGGKEPAPDGGKPSLREKAKQAVSQ